MEITEIRSRLSLETVLSHYSLVPNRGLKLKCLFHDDIIDFIMKYESISKAEAILKAKEMINPGSRLPGLGFCVVPHQSPLSAGLR